MAHATPLTGPDLTVGLAMSDLTENVPFLGHAQGEAIVLSDVLALWWSPRARPRRWRDPSLPLASCVL